MAEVRELPKVALKVIYLFFLFGMIPHYQINKLCHLQLRLKYDSRRMKLV